MELVKAEKSDLQQLKVVFDNIVKNMHNNGVNIWNEYYPYEEFEYDIEANNLYLIKDGETIVATFGVYDSISGIDSFKWSCQDSDALYLGRVGVNINYLKMGIGSKIIEYAKIIAKNKGAKFLRLTVVDINKPAINLYLKNKFLKVEGVYKEVIEETNTTLYEYGFEICVDDKRKDLCKE